MAKPQRLGAHRPVHLEHVLDQVASTPQRLVQSIGVDLEGDVDVERTHQQAPIRDDVLLIDLPPAAIEHGDNVLKLINRIGLVLKEGDPALAQAYAVNIDSAWRHYANRAGNPHPNLFGINYLRALLADQRREEHFWRVSR